VFPYFGSKKRIARKYPAPLYRTVVEPFAGSLGYSMYYRPEESNAFDADERVVELWRRLMVGEVAQSPPRIGTKTDDLLVKLCSYSEHALTSGTMTVTSRMVRDWASLFQRWAETAPWAKEHVSIAHASYEAAPDIEATWFIDPPYQHANRRGYREGSRKIDFSSLADWCKSRRGQVIVCEQEGATWLPFESFNALPTHRGAVSREVVWYRPAG
jgi:hypothetical protein